MSSFRWANREISIPPMSSSNFFPVNVWMSPLELTRSQTIIMREAWKILTQEIHWKFCKSYTSLNSFPSQESGGNSLFIECFFFGNCGTQNARSYNPRNHQETTYGNISFTEIFLVLCKIHWMPLQQFQKSSRLRAFFSSNFPSLKAPKWFCSFMQLCRYFMNNNLHHV